MSAPAFMALGIGYPSPCKRHDHPEIARRGLTVKQISGSWHVEGLVDMANILAPKVKPADKESEGKDNA